MVVVLLLLPKIHGGCPPSSSGEITIITYPFRLQGDPENCCEYHVQAINYDNYTVRVVDPALQHHNCSSLPLRSLSRSNFSDTYTDRMGPYQAGLDPAGNWESLNFEHIMFLNCNHSVREKGKYVESGECVKWDSNGYSYAVGGDLKAKDLEVGCYVKLVAPTSFRTLNNHSYAAIHRALAYGFEISWIKLACQKISCTFGDGSCYLDSSSQKLQCSFGLLDTLAVARGIAYLHHGCEMKILHFDIKPHNILLDENFVPKISDFGLAKLYSIDNSIIPMTAARGTIGYMAPELFYNNIGGISNKADVYSFGMLLMEMASKRKNLNPSVEYSSQLYFPLWIYDHIREEKIIKMEDLTKVEKSMVKKMIIVALWCIQLKPNDRPSMNKVVEMLEGDIKDLEMPPKPFLYPNETVTEDQTINSN
ncbi:hypothetical protein LR48_Vigan07g153300 [Vigna angularis]|uniref:Protein kinase domain-containing protein n=1 Tax=Phaseolus angularis TaxID=3914 RepID=A0A0L9UZ46_PHAAN|nr:hypothetical protein LR48_Vigan07g153300 [Vigna angularis]